MKYAEFCAGVGGFRLGLEAAGANIQLVHSNEIDSSCEKTYERNFGQKFDSKDIFTIEASTLPDFDMLCAGFPCQPFSAAGKELGFADTRGTIFFKLLEIIKEKNPGIVFLENVPMEMHQKEIFAWQKYFTSHGLKQPFEQIWEPVVNPDTVKEDRYAGCMIPYYRFLKQEMHGIYAQSALIQIMGFIADIERIDYDRDSVDVNFEIKRLSFAKYTRQVNHIVAYFDRVTVYDRIRNDDVSIAELLPQFTLAQISEFINIAVENNCTNVSAVLLDYKHRTFTDFDPMDAFALEW